MSDVDELLDFAPVFEKVTVRGKSIAIHGVSAKGIAMLLGRFPELRKMMSGVQVDAARLFELGGEVVGPVIAAGLGRPGDEKVEAAVANFPIEEQVDLIEAILRVTFPKGAKVFIDRLVGLSGSLGGGAQSVTVPDTK